MDSAGLSRYSKRRLYDRDDSDALAAVLDARGRDIPPTLIPLKRNTGNGDTEAERRTRQRGEKVPSAQQLRRSLSLLPSPSPEPTPQRSLSPARPPRPLSPPPVPPSRSQSPVPGPVPRPLPRNPQQSREDFHSSPTPGLQSQVTCIFKAAASIHALKKATLDESGMEADDIFRLRNPSDKPAHDTTDPDIIFALESFLASMTSSEASYMQHTAAARKRHPDDKFYSYHEARNMVRALSGIVPIKHDMCIDSCMGFTGPDADLENCSECGKARKRNGLAMRKFLTIPIGPIAQALYAHCDTAEKMGHRVRMTDKIMLYARLHNGQIKIYDDIYCGSDYLKAVKDGRIKPNDVVIQISLDGAQLYRDKASDAWIFMYTFSSLSADLRYRKKFVFPAGVVGGPNKPKNTDSFLFPALYHIAAVNREGFSYWNAFEDTLVKDARIFVLHGTADGPAMADINGTVGASGKYACRLRCRLQGRRRVGDGHYYPVMLRPNNYAVGGCDHPDVSFQQMRTLREEAQDFYNQGLSNLVTGRARDYASLRLESGISKPTIFSGLYDTLGVPKMFVMDIMHLAGLNDPDLLLGLWRATINSYAPDKKETWDWAVLKGKIWESHGKTVELAWPYLPSSFDRAPRDPAKKMNSQYKAWEYIIYLYGLGPALLRSILPFRYWQNYCKLVRGIRLLYQKRDISPSQLQEGTRLLLEFAKEFELLYYQCMPERIHFIRQSIHLLTHIGPETVRSGPVSCYAQWTMETLIGSLGKEIHNQKDPYANLTQRAVLRSQVNALHAQFPNIACSYDNESRSDCPKYGKPIDGTDYILLPRCQDTLINITNSEAIAIAAYWTAKGWPNPLKAVKCWARLRLPNGQMIRCHWMETENGEQRPGMRITRNVKIVSGDTIDFAEVLYFFSVRFGLDSKHTLAMVSLYSPPDKDILEESFSTIHSCHSLGENGLRVIDISHIQSVVAMVPMMDVAADGEIIISASECFVVEKLGLAVGIFQLEELDDDDNN